MESSQMKNKRKAEKAIKSILDLWQVRLYLHEWDISFSLQSQELPIDQQLGECLADISADPVYLRAHVRVFPAFGTRDSYVQEAALVHELCHCITQEGRDLLSDSRLGKQVNVEQQRAVFERLTQRVANVAMDDWRKPKVLGKPYAR